MMDPELKELIGDCLKDIKDEEKFKDCIKDNLKDIACDRVAEWIVCFFKFNYMPCEAKDVNTSTPICVDCCDFKLDTCVFCAKNLAGIAPCNKQHDDCTCKCGQIGGESG